jgi:hypothetical protein
MEDANRLQALEPQDDDDVDSDDYEGDLGDARKAAIIGLDMAD